MELAVRIGANLIRLTLGAFEIWFGIWLIIAILNTGPKIKP